MGVVAVRRREGCGVYRQQKACKRAFQAAQADSHASQLVLDFRLEQQNSEVRSQVCNLRVEVYIFYPIEDDTSTTHALLNFWMMASVYSFVEALPPKSPVITFPSAMVCELNK
jgi:hypothetical protein